MQKLLKVNYLLDVTQLKYDKVCKKRCQTEVDSKCLYLVDTKKTIDHLCWHLDIFLFLFVFSHAFSWFYQLVLISPELINWCFSNYTPHRGLYQFASLELNKFRILQSAKNDCLRPFVKYSITVIV